MITDAEASTADKEGALAQLQELVEPIDNANGKERLNLQSTRISVIEGFGVGFHPHEHVAFLSL